MRFELYNKNYNVTDLMRRIGYRPLGYTDRGELNAVKPLGANYPRFHIYLKEDKEILSMNIHLDQKKPSYEGSTAHGGDYDSETVRDEVQRIKDLVLE